MPYPVGITTRAVTLGGATALESAEPLILQAIIQSSRGLIWGASGWRFPSLARTVTSTAGAEITVELPVTDLPGWRLIDAEGSILDVSVPGSYTHTYTVTLIALTAANKIVSQRILGPFVLPTGDGSPVDLDTLLPVGTVAGGVVLVPDTWTGAVSDAVAAAELAAVNAAGRLTPQVFGAIGNGIADDTAAMQAWLNSASVAGGVLNLPPGKYLVPNGGLTCSAPVQIVGAGTGTYETNSGGARILTSSTTANLLTLNAPGSVVSGVTFENTAPIGTETAGAAILATDFDWGRIERCMFVGFWRQVQVDSGYFYSIRDSAFLRPVQYGAYMRNTAAGQHDHGDQVLEGCNFSKYGSTIDGATAIRWESGGGLRIVGCKANAGTQPGYPTTRFWTNCVSVHMAAGDTSVFVVSGSSFEGYLSNAIVIDGEAGATFGKIAITGNEFLASGSSGAVVKLDGSAMTSLNSVVVSGNVAYGSGAGVSLTNVSRAAVVGNEFGGLALDVLSLTNVDKVRFAGNQAEGSVIDNDANDGTSAVGQGRDPWLIRKDFTALTGTAGFGAATIGNYGLAKVTIRARGNVQTVGGFYLEQTRMVSRVLGAATVGATIGTDISSGPAAAEVTIAWDVATSPRLIPKLTSVNGKTAFGVIDVTIDGPVYSLRYVYP